MFAKSFAAACGLALLAGCAGESAGPAVSADHPASPDAAVAPVPPVSTTLAVDPPPPSTEASPDDHSHHHGGAAPATAPTAATRPAQGAAVYACPHHPEVTSDKPDQRCPKCGMKLVKQDPAPAAGRHEGHHD